MRSLAGVSFLALLIGCGSDDAGRVFVDATWMFRTVAANTPLDCPADYPTVDLHIGDHITTFDCSAGSGRSDGVAPGTYDVWLEVYAAEPRASYATSQIKSLDLSLGDRTFAYQFLTDGGVFTAAWRLLDGSGNEVDCDTAAAVGVVLEGIDESNPQVDNTDELDCADGQGTSFAYAARSYRVDLEAVDDAGQSLGISDALAGQVITAPAGITDLGIIDITIPGL